MSQAPLQIVVADHPLARFIGLMGKRSWDNNQALLISGCKQIHTWFMRFPIDVVFFDADQRIIKVIEGLPPWCVSPFVSEAQGCLEFAAHQAKSYGLVLGASMTI